MWEQRTFGNKGEGQDYSRADVLGYAVWTWPADAKINAWLEEKWDGWERDQPKFFTEKWIKRIRREVRPNFYSDLGFREKQPNHTVYPSRS